MILRPVIEPLGKQHDRTSFDCGVEPLNRYIREQASQDAKKKVAAAFVLTERASTVIGYYTLSSTGIDIGTLPESISKKLPRYPVMPATLLGRLAVDKHYRGKGYGELLLLDAMKRSLLNTEQIGSAAIIVDAKGEVAKRFYLHFQFIPLASHMKRLFLPMAIIKDYFKE
jgi:GNAT superfamily N-acetyltransferase